jgi:hypothetical protein
METLFELMSRLPVSLQLLSATWAIAGVGLLAITANHVSREAVEALEAKIAEAEQRSRVQTERILLEVRDLARRTETSNRPESERDNG